MALNKAVSIIVLSIGILFLSDQYLVAEKEFSSDEIIKEVSNNISEEYVTCSAFYFYSSEGLRRSGDIKTALKYEEYRNKAANFALIAAKKGRTQEIAEKVTLARLDLEMKSMLNEIDSDISNISILMNKYLDHCKEIMEDPNKIMEEWTEKILKKHNLK
jgi:hypothetical protein